jgi:hypothetical protein
MLVLVPTREDVLAIQSVEDAFDLRTTTIKPWEVALIRVALAEGLLESTLHALEAAEDELVPEAAVDRVIASGRAVSKDIAAGPRQIGINFEGRIRGRRILRVKVSWEDCYYVPTVHTV